MATYNTRATRKQKSEMQSINVEGTALDKHRRRRRIKNKLSKASRKANRK